MKRLSDELIQFLHRQNFVIIASISRKGALHAACKGIVKINQNGRIYLLDLYKGRTFENIKRNPHVALTAVDEHKFSGYCLQGKARIKRDDRLSPHIITAWEKKVTQRITHRVIKNIGGHKGHPRHPEVLLPKPEYMFVIEVDEIIDLTPHHLKKG